MCQNLGIWSAASHGTGNRPHAGVGLGLLLLLLLFFFMFYVYVHRPALCSLRTIG